MIHQILQVKTDTLNTDGLRREYEYKSSAGDLIMAWKFLLLKSLHWKLSILLFECGLKSFWYKTKALPFELWFLFERFNDYIVRMSVILNVWDRFGLQRTAFSQLSQHNTIFPKDFETQVWITPLEPKVLVCLDSRPSTFPRSSTWWPLTFLL